MYTILICDDDRDIVSALDIYLTSEGYRTIAAYNGREAIQAAEENEIHLILMDVMMPELDGIRATAKLREGSNVPIILLTAKSEDTDKILGLNIGADDYITKPFNPLEVIARVKSQLRRYTALGGAEKAPGMLTVGPISMDDGSKQVMVDGAPVSLTPIEYKLLCLLSKNVGKVLTHTFITQNIWGRSWDNDVASLRVFMATLRKKLEPTEESPQYIQTHIGVGYRMIKVE